MSVLDIFMLVLFVAFMFFIFGGYHKVKYKQRDQENLKDEKEL